MPVVAQEHKRDCKRGRLLVRFPYEEMEYLTFSFLRSGNETMH